MMQQTDIEALGKVAVLLGGWSSEREVSLLSGQGVLDALLARGVDAYPFDPAERELSELKSEGFDRVFIALHGRYGEDGAIQGALEVLRIPYTGPGVMASSIGMDKVMTKRVWIADGLPTPRHALTHAGRLDAGELDRIVAATGLPVVVKPAHEGSSIGVTKVHDRADLAPAIAAAGQHDGNVLCEQFIAGDEVTAAVIGTGAEARVLPLIRIVAPDGNYDYENKYFTDVTQYLCPAELPEGEEQRIQALVLEAYKLVGARGWSRLDVMIDGATRDPYLIEINTSPGMTGHSLVPLAARVAGISYDELCLQLLQAAALDNGKEETRA